MIQDNEALREIVNKYKGEGKEISEEVLINLKAILHEILGPVFEEEEQEIPSFSLSKYSLIKLKSTNNEIKKNNQNLGKEKFWLIR